MTNSSIKHSNSKKENAAEIIENNFVSFDQYFKKIKNKQNSDFHIINNQQSPSKRTTEKMEDLVEKSVSSKFEVFLNVL